MESDKTGLKIGLAFSGGGFRASSFSLGLLSYLNHVNIDKSTLLHKVHALSTISGGTIAGSRYAVGIKRNERFHQIYTDLYKFMAEVDLIRESLNKLTETKAKDDKRIKSLITAFADVYDKLLFDGCMFGTLLSDDTPIHLKHISFNATEFANALQFRFQKTEKIDNIKNGEPDKGIIGNYYYRIPEEIAKDIRMADILAASTCFPGGFEPINFPNDFGLPQNKRLEDYIHSNNFPVGLMDGGIVDNQGIEPLLLAEQRMQRGNQNEKEKSSESNEFDLLIIADVTSPYMKDYQASKESPPNFWRKLTFKKIIAISMVTLFFSVMGLIYSIFSNLIIGSIVATLLITLNILLYIVLSTIIKLPAKFQVPEAFLKPLAKLLKVKFSVYENMILNRSNSLLKMTNDVFLKHIRRLNYNKIYQDKSWINRRIMSAIYELRHEEKRLQDKISEGRLDKDLIPSDEIQKVASTASDMGTTLWFTSDELKTRNMLNSIIATGQFTICWNLLEYIRNIKKETDNISENHKIIIDCEEQIKEHWEKFNKDPFWLVKNYTNSNV